MTCILDSRAGEAGHRSFVGHTQPPGGPHAEVVALRAAEAAGVDVRGATAWVTLEPCAHHGRTPPCCDALIRAGVARVVVALVDPNPLVAGQGIARMRAAGIEVQVAGAFSGDFAARFAAEHHEDPQGLTWAGEAFELNIGFFSRMVRGRPWVRMKIAASLDGQTALTNGASQWITSEAARTDGHAWRRRAGAVLTGIGTVREDDPRLDVRLVDTQRQPMRVVVDSRLEIDPAARILQPPGQVLVCCAQDHAGSDKARALTRFTVTDADRAAKILAASAGQVLANARVLAETLIERGLRIVSGRTESHVMLVDLRPKGLTGKEAEAVLGQAHMTCNKNGIPNDPQKPMVTSGIRLGSPAMTTRGFKEEQARQTGHLIADVLDKPHDEANIAAVRQKVTALTSAFPVYG